MSKATQLITRGLAAASLMGLAIVGPIAAPASAQTQQAANTGVVADPPGYVQPAAWRYIDRYFWKTDCQNAGDRGRSQGLWSRYQCRYGGLFSYYELWVM